MPLYEYQCVDCPERDQRIAGLDDHVSVCARCGGLMLRLDEDPFTRYFAVPIFSVLEEQGDGYEKSGI